MRHLVGIIAAAALAAAGAARAKDVQVAGAWGIEGEIQAGTQAAVAHPTCTFKQTGTAISGVCEGINATGPASGTVTGQHVKWEWRHTPKSDVGLKGVSVFDGEMGPDGIIKGAWTFDGFPDAKGTFTATRP
jgi:hypothetical protein